MQQQRRNDTNEMKCDADRDAASHLSNGLASRNHELLDSGISTRFTKQRCGQRGRGVLVCVLVLDGDSRDRGTCRKPRPAQR